jgi:YVTN family beta-propeller protein
MQFRLLGPLEVEDNGRPLVLGSAKQRALLAILLLHANEVVSRDRLIDQLWGEQQPANAPHSLDVYVSRLRKTLQASGGEQLLVTRAGGYLLRLDPDQLDVTCFERLLDEGRRALAASNHERASERFAEALALWRGPAFGDLAYEPFARPEIERLEEQRLAALEERIEAELALGHHPSLIGELESLSGKHPLRERVHGQLILALYRSGRQAEALEAYRETRQHLLDELGINPSPTLQQLEQAILRQDPTLELPARPVAREDGRPPVEPMSPKQRLPSTDHWRPALVAVGVAGLLVTAVAGAIVFFTGSPSPSLEGVGANAVGILDPKTGDINAEVLLHSAPDQVAAGAGSIWAVTRNRQTVSRLDPATGHVVGDIDVGAGPAGIAYSREGRAVWVANSLDGTVSRIDPGTNRVVDTIPVGNVPVAVAFGFGSVWITNVGDRSVTRLDARSGDPVATILTGDVGRGIAVGGGAVWVSDDDGGTVSRIEPRTNGVTKRIRVGNGATALAYGARSLWVANGFDRTISRIEPKTSAVTNVPTGGTPGNLAFADGALWVSDEARGRILQVDPQQNKVVDTVETGNRPEGLAAAAGHLWFAVQASGGRHRGGTLRVVSYGDPFDSLDPGLGYDGPALNILSMAYDGLTALKRVGSIDGTKLVPDLANSLPAVSDGGRTYVFELRPGIHYSNGRLVRPADFRYALERTAALRLHSFSAPPPFYEEIRGGASCVRRATRCDLSRGVIADARARTVTFKLVAPDPDFLYKLAQPVAAAIPVGTPKRKTIVPATGAYQIASYTSKRLVLERNPHFHEWSQAAKPDGFPDRIIWTFTRLRPSGCADSVPAPVAQAICVETASKRAEVRAVEQGNEDVAFDGAPRELVREVTTQYARQAHPHPNWEVTYLFLNTKVPPFDDVRVRRAVSFGADRTAAVRSAAQALGAQPTCQILPPSFPGFRPYCPYTLHPGRTAIWNGPDLERARRLVAASGTKGTPITIWVPNNHRAEGPFAAALMHSLGYPTRIKQVSDLVYYDPAKGPGNPRHRVQAGPFTWGADYPAPSNFINVLLSCAAAAEGGNYSHFCDPSIDARIRRALALQATDFSRANQLWAQIDQEIVDQAPVVPLITHKQMEFVSNRIGNYQYNPQWGILLDQLWVR